MINKADLLRRWVEAYPEQLRPKRLLGRFRTDNQNLVEGHPADRI